LIQDGIWWAKSEILRVDFQRKDLVVVVEQPVTSAPLALEGNMGWNSIAMDSHGNLSVDPLAKCVSPHASEGTAFLKHAP